jgi:DNA-binding response OmpR family regulator
MRVSQFPHRCSEQAIDALVRRLRDRIAEIDPEHQYIITVKGHGFRFENA